MKIRKFLVLLLYLLIVSVVFLSACAQSAETELPPQEPAAEEPTSEEPTAEEPAAEELTKIRMAVLPVLELTPIYVAMQEGIMAKNGIEVEMIPVASGQEKDQLLAIAEADCGQAEHLSVILSNQEEITQQNITGSFLSSESHPIFSIIAGADSGIESVEDLKGVEIGTSEGTVNEYVAARVLQKNGFSDDEIKFLGRPPHSRPHGPSRKRRTQSSIASDPSWFNGCANTGCKNNC